jgi:hypothetical protein
MALYVFIGLIALGVFSIFHLLRAFLYWELRWDLRLLRLIIHSALLGSAATVAALFFAGMLKV